MSGRRASIRFRDDRERSWRALEKLVSKIERHGIRKLSELELTELPVLHRAAVSSLSVARAISLDRNVLEYLEALTARSHACVYGVRRDFAVALRDFFVTEFPAAVWRARAYVVTSIALLTIAILVGRLLVLEDPERFYSLVGEGMSQGRDPGASYDTLHESLYGSREEHSAGSLTAFASMLFSHNTQIGFLCFALGFAAGVPVLYLLAMNGMLLGAMAAVFEMQGLGSDFWAWVSGHGVTELLAIALCAAGGLLQGYAVVFPGKRTRLASLAKAGRHAGRIVIGTVLLFVLAALLEGYFRQIVQSKVARFFVSACTAGLWIYYFGWHGRRAAARERTAHG